MSSSYVPTHEQIEVLVDFIEKKRWLATGHARTTHARQRTRTAWQEVAQKLNRVECGCRKTWQQWAKYWKDKKGAIKRKVMQMKVNNKTQTSDDGEEDEITLSTLEKRMLALLGGKVYAVSNKVEESDPFTNFNLGEHREVAKPFDITFINDQHASDRTDCEQNTRDSDELPDEKPPIRRNSLRNEPSDTSNIMSQESDCISRFFDSEDNKITSLSRSLLLLKTLDSSQDMSQASTGSESELSFSQLTIEEPEPIKVPPFYNLTPRPLPQSPHYVIEEEFSANPWAMLVATIFLTKTSGKTARPYMKSFFEEYPTPYHVLSETPTTLEGYFDNLGLRKRGQMIWKLSYQFVSAKWRRASDLCGIGKYGEDAYRIFCLGHTDVDPEDRFLKLYLDWLSSHTEFMKDNGVTDSEHVIEDPVLKYYRITLK